MTEELGSPFDSAWMAKLLRGSLRSDDERMGLPSTSLKSCSMSVMSPIVEKHIYITIKLAKSSKTRSEMNGVSDCRIYIYNELYINPMVTDQLHASGINLRSESSTPSQQPKCH